MNEMKAIEGIPVSDRLDGLWNIQVKDWAYGDELCDLQDLLVRITTSRARVIESEIQPQSVRMRTRNTMLENLGNLLSKFSAVQSKFDPEKKGDSEGSKSIGTLTAGDRQALNLIGKPVAATVTNPSYTRSQVEEIIQLIKTKMDKFNNESQSDMTRLQGLVDKRDSAFTSASQLMSGVSDTRSNLIKAL